MFEIIFLNIKKLNYRFNLINICKTIIIKSVSVKNYYILTNYFNQ